jgi:hypothetical protein
MNSQAELLVFRTYPARAESGQYLAVLKPFAPQCDTPIGFYAGGQ